MLQKLWNTDLLYLCKNEEVAVFICNNSYFDQFYDYVICNSYLFK